MADLGQFVSVEVSRTSEVAVPLNRAAYFHVRGILKVAGTVAARRVVLLDRRTLAYVTSCFSKSDGSFEFRSMTEQAFQDHFIVIAFDDTRKYNAEVVDFVKQVETLGV